MKIAMTLVCRDEIDIIETQLEYHFPKVDLMLVTDNGSIDGTQKILESYVCENFILFREPRLNKMQYVSVDKMIRVAASYGADWVINVDTDEFLLGNIRGEIERIHNEGYNCFDVPWCTFRPTWRDPLWETCVPRRMLWREAKYLKDSKAIHRTEDYMGISQGNHVVHMREGTKNSAGRDTTLSLCHYPNRGWERWRGKMLRAGEAYDNGNNLGDWAGSHVKKAYHTWKTEGEEGLYHLWEEKYAGNDRDLYDMDLIFDHRMAAEFGLTLEESMERSKIG